MRKNYWKSLAIGAMLGMSVPANANLVGIDFNDLATGSAVTTQYSHLGATFSLIGTSIPGPNTYALVDGSTPLNIFGATGNAINPGDDHRDPFFNIEITFSQQIDYFSILALDAEESFSILGYSGTQLLESATKTLLGTRHMGPFGGSVYQNELGVMGGSTLFDRVIIAPTQGAFPGSSGGPEFFDNLVFNTIPSNVPEPGSLSLIVFGLFGLAYTLRVGRSGCTKATKRLVL